MAELYQFMGEHPTLTFFLVFLALQVALAPFRLVNRWIRHRNIAASGWPPFHLDGDGDTRSLDDDDVAALKASQQGQER